MSARPRRSQSVELSMDDILQAAIRLLDSSGVEAFSMRMLAEQLGRSTMSTYRYVPNREALLRLAADAVDSDVPPMEVDTAWHERLERIARHGWTTAWQEHPWVVEYLDEVEVTPKAIRRQIALEQIFTEAGFAPDQIKVALAASWTWLVGLLQLVLEWRRRGPVDLAMETTHFEFNLRAWILGIVAMANGWDATGLLEDRRGS